MKKSLIILAMLALIAGNAFAGETCTMETKIYGKIHFSLESLNDGDQSGLFMSNNSSRIGFKGSRELNETLSAIWQIETKIEWIDGKGSTWASRNTYAGIKGNFGALKFGYHDTPLKTVGRKFDFFGDTLGDTRNVLDAEMEGDSMDLDSRFDNVVMYCTPDFDGFSAELAYEMCEKSDYDPMTKAIADEETYSDMSMAAYYKAESFMIAGAMQMRPDGKWAGPVDDNETQTAMRFGGKYWAEKFALAGLFQSVSNVFGDEDVSYTVMGFGGSFDANETIQIKAQYYMGKVSVEGMDDDPAFSQLTFGADYNIAKGTAFYALYSMMSNDEYTMMGIGGGGHGQMVAPFAPDESASGFGVGMIHMF
jgi:predicted porin